MGGAAPAILTFGLGKLGYDKLIKEPRQQAKEAERAVKQQLAQQQSIFDAVTRRREEEESEATAQRTQTQARARQRQVALGAAGRRDTLLTGVFGLPDEPMTAGRTILGG